MVALCWAVSSLIAPSLRLWTSRSNQSPERVTQPRINGTLIPGSCLIMDAAAVGVAQKEDEEQGIDEQDIFDRVVSFLATIPCRLRSRVLGADDTPFGPVMGQRGDAGAA